MQPRVQPGDAIIVPTHARPRFRIGIGPETAEVLHRKGYVLEHIWHVANGAIAIYRSTAPGR